MEKYICRSSLPRDYKNSNDHPPDLNFHLINRLNYSQDEAYRQYKVNFIRWLTFFDFLVWRYFWLLLKLINKTSLSSFGKVYNVTNT